LNLSCKSCKPGIAIRQGPHQVAQKSSSTTFCPRYELNVTVLLDKSGKEKSGAGCTVLDISHCPHGAPRFGGA
jgi:hypothetical protein